MNWRRYMTSTKAAFQIYKVQSREIARKNLWYAKRANFQLKIYNF